MELNPPNAHRWQIKISETGQTQNVNFWFMPNAFQILKPIQRSSKRIWVSPITQVLTHLPKTACVWHMKINVICTVCPVSGWRMVTCYYNENNGNMSQYSTTHNFMTTWCHNMCQDNDIQFMISPRTWFPTMHVCLVSVSLSNCRWFIGTAQMPHISHLTLDADEPKQFIACLFFVPCAIA